MRSGQDKDRKGAAIKQLHVIGLSLFQVHTSLLDTDIVIWKDPVINEVINDGQFFWATVICLKVRRVLIQSIIE